MAVVVVDAVEEDDDDDDDDNVVTAVVVEAEGEFETGAVRGAVAVCSLGF